MNSDTVVCSECGCPYSSELTCCPECGSPNPISVTVNYRGYATECSCCGAPSSGLRICQWCGNPIRYVGTHSSISKSNNRAVLECEFMRVVNERNLYKYTVCHICVNGHELMQLWDDGNPCGISLLLLGISGVLSTNFNSYEEKHSFQLVRCGMYSRYFGIDYNSAAAVAEDILQTVYEVSSEHVSCGIEHGQNNGGSEGDIAAAAIGGVILGALIDNY